MNADTAEFRLATEPMLTSGVKLHSAFIVMLHTLTSEVLETSNGVWNHALMRCFSCSGLMKINAADLVSQQDGFVNQGDKGRAVPRLSGCCRSLQ